MEIRQAEQEDIASICAFDAHGEREERRRFIQDSVTSAAASVAVIDGRVVGYVVLEYTFYSQGFISMLYVHPSHRRVGVGLALMRHAESLCKTDKLFTSTNELNRPMHTLLIRLGYSPSGVINNLDEGDPEIVYFKRGQKTYFDRDG